MIRARERELEMSKPKAPTGYEANAAMALISGEHRFLQGEFEALQADLEAGVELAATSGAKTFITLTTKHFLHEEWAMRASSFPDLADHAVSHRRFVSDADSMLCKLCSDPARQQERTALTEILSHWVEHHQEYDRRFTEFSHELLDARELVFDPTQEFSAQSPKAIGERRLAAVLFADVAGFSRLVGENEAEAIAAWCSCWHQIVKPAVVARAGRVVKNTGDGFIAEFALTTDAVHCAMVIQKAVSQNESTITLCRPLKLRMGIHVCHVVPFGTDIFGHGVNVAARLQAEAPPGTICISESGRRAIGSPEGFNFIDFGYRQLRNIDEPFRVYAIEPWAHKSSER
jgi:hemerythrin-like metal-binding protein